VNDFADAVALAPPGTESARKAVVPQLNSSGRPSSRTTLGMMVETRNQPKAWMATPILMVQTARREGPNMSVRHVGAGAAPDGAPLALSLISARVILRIETRASRPP